MGEEFAALLRELDLLGAAAFGDDPEEDTVAARRGVSAAALTLARRVQVTRSQERDLSLAQISLASHQVLVDLLREVRQLGEEVASLGAAVRCRGAGGGSGSQGASHGEEEEEEEEEDSLASLTETGEAGEGEEEMEEDL